MSLNTVTTGNTVLASDVNQLVNVLQRAASQTEVGYYYLNGWGNASGDQIGYGVNMLSKTSTPVSVSTDTSVQSATNIGSVGTNALNANGFHIFANTTGSTTAAYVGGAWTVQF